MNGNPFWLAAYEQLLHRIRQDDGSHGHRSVRAHQTAKLTAQDIKKNGQDGFAVLPVLILWRSLRLSLFQNWVQGCDFTVVVPLNMSDKQGQQRRGGPMARYGRLLTDAQWEKIRPLLPKRRKRPQGGRPPADDRKVLEGILWILRSGARWCDLPVEFPSPSTVGGDCATGRSKRSG